MTWKRTFRCAALCDANGMVQPCSCQLAMEAGHRRPTSSANEAFALRPRTSAKCRSGSFVSLSTASDQVGFYPNNDQSRDPPRRSERVDSVEKVCGCAG